MTAAIHDRMPVILDPDGYDWWRDPGMKNVDAVSDLLKTLCCPADGLLSREHADRGVVNHDEQCAACGACPNS